MRDLTEISIHHVAVFLPGLQTLQCLVLVFQTLSRTIEIASLRDQRQLAKFRAGRLVQGSWLDLWTLSTVSVMKQRLSHRRLPFVNV